MDISYQEKSAWGSLVGLGLVAYWYFPTAFDIADNSNHPGSLFALSVGCIVAIIIIESIYHGVIALRGDNESDERESLIDLKSERWSGYILAVGLFWLVGHIIANNALGETHEIGSLMVAVWVMFALSVSEVSKRIIQIIYYRAHA
jgi:hypothetical protein